MVRGSELAFRTMIRRYGVGHCYSPMLRAAEVVKAFQIWEEEGMNFYEKVTHEDGILLLTDICGKDTARLDTNSVSSCEEGLLTVQLCGSCPKTLYSATRILLQLQVTEGLNLYGIDLNLGCPQKCAEDGCFGAFLVENEPELTLECVEAMRHAINTFQPSSKADFHSSLSSSSGCPRVPRLSCKIRLLETDEETISFAKKLQEAGCEILALHCRRRIDKHKGKPDLISGSKVVKALSIPVVINGSEIDSLHGVENTIERTGAHSIMVARAFLRNPRMLVETEVDPAFLAAEYLDCCERQNPPSALYIQKHLRWIFRKYLQPKKRLEEKVCDYGDWRARLWSFLVRPYLKTIYQFRQVVALYVKLNGSELPPSLKNLPEPSFQSIRHCHSESFESEVEMEMYQTEILVNLFN